MRDDIKLKNITRKFNRFRAPECRVKTVKNTKEEIEIEFTGTAADFSCCFDEHFIDYKYLLMDIFKLEFKIEEIERINDDKFIVIYKKGGKNGIKRIDGSIE